MPGLGSFADINLCDVLTPNSPTRQDQCYLHLTDDDTGTQKDQVTYSKSYN